MLDRMKHISDRAYYLWEAAGRPEGREEEFWLEAEAEYDRMNPEPAVPSKAKAAKKVAKKAAKKTVKKAAKKAVKKTAKRKKRGQ